MKEYYLTFVALFQQDYVQRLFIAALLGLCVGLERELRGKAASLRTFSMLCTASCLYSIMSIELAGSSTPTMPYDVTRIAAQIVVGVGFIGGGVIFKTADRVEGLTTATLIWLTAAIGMAIGFGKVDLALWAILAGAFIHAIAFIFYKIFYAIRGEDSPVVSAD